MNEARIRPRLENRRPTDECCGTNATAAVCEDKPRDTNAIEHRIQKLGGSLGSLEKTVASLTERLNSVLCPSETCKKHGIGQDQMPVLSPLAEQLTILNTRVQLLESEIEGLVGRLEL